MNIKFKAFSEDLGKPVEVHYIDFLRKGFGVQYGQNSDAVRWEYPDYFELLQYTGRNDINGKELYYKDFVLFLDSDNNLNFGQISHGSCSFFIKKSSYISYYRWMDYEVLLCEPLMTSDKWLDAMQILTKRQYVVLDPDGWDKKNYQYSFYEEKIDFSEFNKRLIHSTIKWNF